MEKMRNAQKEIERNYKALKRHVQALQQGKPSQDWLRRHVQPKGPSGLMDAKDV